MQPQLAQFGIPHFLFLFLFVLHLDSIDGYYEAQYVFGCDGY